MTNEPQGVWGEAALLRLIGEMVEALEAPLISPHHNTANGFLLALAKDALRRGGVNRLAAHYHHLANPPIPVNDNGNGSCLICRVALSPGEKVWIRRGYGEGAVICAKTDCATAAFRAGFRHSGRQ